MIAAFQSYQCRYCARSCELSIHAAPAHQGLFCPLQQSASLARDSETLKQAPSGWFTCINQTLSSWFKHCHPQGACQSTSSSWRPHLAVEITLRYDVANQHSRAAAWGAWSHDTLCLHGPDTLHASVQPSSSPTHNDLLAAAIAAVELARPNSIRHPAGAAHQKRTTYTMLNQWSKSTTAAACCACRDQGLTQHPMEGAATGQVAGHSRTTRHKDQSRAVGGYHCWGCAAVAEANSTTSGLACGV